MAHKKGGGPLETVAIVIRNIWELNGTPANRFERGTFSFANEEPSFIQAITSAWARTTPSLPRRPES